MAGISANWDALIPAGGGGDPLQGVSRRSWSVPERPAHIRSLFSTHFLPYLGDRLENGASMAGEFGGHFCDPLIAFMMVYNAVKGNYKDFGGKFAKLSSIPISVCYHLQMITRIMRSIF